MEQKILMDALVEMKRTGNLLNEVHDLSRELAEAIDRNDQVSVEMLIAMRQEPINKLEESDQLLREQLYSLPDAADIARLAALLNGTAEPAEDERMLTDQVAANRRKLDQILALDKQLNLKMGREKSVYS